MQRRLFLAHSALGLLGFGAAASLGCRNQAHVLKTDQNDMIGNRAAGGEVYKPLVDEAVAKLLGRHTVGVHTASTAAAHHRICFVAVENKSAEELGDFKDQIYQLIDSQIHASHVYQPVNKRFVDAALRETRLRPDQLFIPQNMRAFTAILEQQGQPIDFLLYATLTSGTTNSGKDYQRDYLLTLEMIDLRTGDNDKESATLRKGYHRSPLGRLWNYGR
jgi:hypothetical protein